MYFMPLSIFPFSWGCLTLQATGVMLKGLRKSKNESLKYDDYKVNRSVATGLMKDEIIEMLLAPEDLWEIRYKKLIKTIKRYTIPIIPNRHFERIPKLFGKFFLKKRKAV